jgi:hypothetical protein
MLISSNADVWRQYVRHDFVRQLGEGTLSRERFLHFIKYVIAPTILVTLSRGSLFQAGLSLPQILREGKWVQPRSLSSSHATSNNIHNS